MKFLSLLFAVGAMSQSVFAQGWPKAWYEPVEPIRIVGNIHYVGTRDLAVYLITTPAGHILLDGAMPESPALVEASIRKLGFKPEDIRILLTTQAHIDHVGTMAHFKKLTKGKVQATAYDADLLKSGGKADYLFGDSAKLHFEPVTADRVLKDGETISLGGFELTVRATPGHTRGCSTYLATVTEGGRAYRVVFPGSASVNAGTRLVVNPSYPGIADDYKKTFRYLESLQPDIFLSAHASAFGYEAKRAKVATEGVQAWVDPEGFKKLITAQEKAFDMLVAAEK